MRAPICMKQKPNDFVSKNKKLLKAISLILIILALIKFVSQKITWLIAAEK